LPIENNPSVKTQGRLHLLNVLVVSSGRFNSSHIPAICSLALSFFRALLNDTSTPKHAVQLRM
jgi:hypothetical protein